MNDAESIGSIERALLEATPLGIILFDAEGAMVHSNKNADLLTSSAAGGEMILSEPDFLNTFRITALPAELDQDRQECTVNQKTMLIFRQRLSGFDAPKIAYFLQDVSGQKSRINGIYDQESKSLWQIRSRITSVQNALILLSDYCTQKADTENRELFMEAIFEIWWISNYTDHLSDLSLLNANLLDKQLDIEEVDVKEVAAEAMSDINSFASNRDKQYVMTNEIPAGTMIRCDKRRTTRIVGVILLNAITHSVKKVSIVTSIEDSGDGMATLLIKDDGAGIPPSEQTNIFNYESLLSKTKDKIFFGKGLELYLARQIMNRMGGVISFESKERKGSIFSLTFLKGRGPHDLK